MQNADIKELYTIVKNYKKKKKAIPYDADYYPTGGVPTPYSDCLSKYYSEACQRKRSPKGKIEGGVPRAQAANSYHPTIDYDTNVNMINRPGNYVPHNSPDWTGDPTIQR